MDKDKTKKEIRELYGCTSHFCFFTQRNIIKLNAIVTMLQNENINAYKFIASAIDIEKIAGSIYCIHNRMYDVYGPNIHKLGRSINVSKRLIQHSSSYLEPCCTEYIADVDDNVLAEKLLFKRLNAFRIIKNREFFNCELNAIVFTMEEIKCIVHDYYQDALAEYLEYLIKTHTVDAPDRTVRRRASCTNNDSDDKLISKTFTRTRANSAL